ncbi:4Fe-4S cluster-binding domain-containing protein [Arthrobacter sp. JCM 19049]|uniref:4Fe-4S cluster-binding domain-containing protein n=1 Tax=Arthrobacter sp. JCM 19049 TaxID=1460643 RepID=UPI000B153C08
MPGALRVARVLHATRAEGPHLRSAIWVQGCSIRCKGCINRTCSPNAEEHCGKSVTLLPRPNSMRLRASL